MPNQYSVQNPHCGCPVESQFKNCWDCRTPTHLQTRILYPPTKCVKQPCGFVIPPVHCADGELKRVGYVEHTYDLTVDEPGPNDSYGLNGLNWWDWKMDYYNSKRFKSSVTNIAIPDHPYLTKEVIPHNFPDVLCGLPIECYGRTPGPLVDTPFKQPVNYSRDWRCRSALPPSPWKPPTVAWATNQHL